MNVISAHFSQPQYDYNSRDEDFLRNYIRCAYPDNQKTYWEPFSTLQENLCDRLDFTYDIIRDRDRVIESVNLLHNDKDGKPAFEVLVRQVSTFPSIIDLPVNQEVPALEIDQFLHHHIRHLSTRVYPRPNDIYNAEPIIRRFKYVMEDMVDLVRLYALPPSMVVTTDAALDVSLLLVPVDADVTWRGSIQLAYSNSLSLARMVPVLPDSPH